MYLRAYLLAGGPVVPVRAGAVEAVFGLVAQPGLARAVVPAGRVAAALQDHGAVLPPPARRAQAEVRRAAVEALAVRAGLVPATRRLAVSTRKPIAMLLNAVKVIRFHHIHLWHSSISISQCSPS